MCSLFGGKGGTELSLTIDHAHGHTCLLVSCAFSCLLDFPLDIHMLTPGHKTLPHLGDPLLLSLFLRAQGVTCMKPSICVW